MKKIIVNDQIWAYDDMACGSLKIISPEDKIFRMPYNKVTIDPSGQISRTYEIEEYILKEIIRK